MKLYTVARDGQELGTWDADTVWAKIAAGQILPTDHAWSEGMAEWSTISLLFPAAAPPNPTPAASQPAPAAHTSRPPSGGLLFKSVGTVAILIATFMLIATGMDGGVARPQPPSLLYYYTMGCLFLGGLIVFVVGRFQD